ncbi:conserved Plasmodium protein, unknown function [Plasmodium gallinaceum]|uniref:Serine aminopeptidase S33 domain-containing protein n=1 Tax=Plasmodium gallinaceum TaxID=5849 RepID=A0A1J1GQU3_PLAGA|nr:conserved Plasmodium protein, unknown function [Plasmodium gallinaceum]CRG93410.1 conserved Plasmodium protein, unknown function [Plasmodium gallinaceum]
MYFYQDSYIFQYGKLEPNYEYTIGDNYEYVYLKTEEGYLHKCWFIKAEGQEKKPVILYFLGSGGIIEKHIDVFNKMIENLSVDIFSCSNRGSGTNEGKPTEKDLYKDAEIYLNYLKKENIPHIFVFGSSMGGAVAIEMALRHQDYITGLIIQNTFLSLKKLAKYTYPFLYYCLINYNLIIRSKMDNESKIKEIHIPTLFNISLKDKVVPPFHSNLLHELCPSIFKFLYLSPNGTHANITKDDEVKYYASFKEFVEFSVFLKERNEEKKNELLDN